MKAFLVVAGIVIASFLAGVWYARGKVAPAPATGRRIVKYICPMHPKYTSDHPGIAPCCGMRLEPVYEDAAGSRPDQSARSLPQLRGVVHISLDKQQLIGVRFGRVESFSGSETVRVLGRVALDDRSVYRMITAVEGWVREISPPAPGNVVRKDELLATIFSQDLLTPQQAYVYALGAKDRETKSERGSAQAEYVGVQISRAEQALQTMGISEFQIHELARTRTGRPVLELRAPVTGVIAARNLSRGMRVERNAELYRIADLSRVWVLADIYERDESFLRPNARAYVKYKERVLPATVSDALPQFDGATRTLKVRLELDNPGNLLRPDMFVNVELPVHLQRALTVPVDALIDSGERKTVYVHSGDGLFEPRPVQVVWQFGDRVGISKGLEAGEQVVCGGTFLIDSESRMKREISPHQERDPVCGMNVVPEAPDTIKFRQGSRTFYFCSPECRKSFEKAALEKPSLSRSVVPQW